MKLTIGQLVDKLSIVNIKIYMLEDVKREPKATNKTIADATKKTNVLNSERNVLIDEIDIGLNEIADGVKQTLFGSNKKYGSE